jgi:hypothetical protein
LITETSTEVETKDAELTTLKTTEEEELRTSETNVDNVDNSPTDVETKTDAPVNNDELVQIL